ncbi:MAG: AraC family transcriptional regulator [Polyangiaceae bacterium]
MSKRRSFVTLRLSADAQIVLGGTASALLVVNDGCLLRERSGKSQRLEAGTLLVRAPQRGATAPDRHVARAIALMQQMLSKDLDVKQLARAVGLSRAAFAKRFVAATGCSPHRFLQALRLERAAVLLTEGDQGLAEIAAQVGYASEFAFSRAFKRHHGVAPSVYRRSPGNAPCMMRAA